MRFISKYLLLILIFAVFVISAPAVYALPYYTLLYKTSANGRMFGYNDFDFSLVPGKIYPGGVAIYIGEDKLNNNEPTIIEVDYSGVRKIPAKYFVDLGKGERFLGAKIPVEFKYSEELDRKILGNIMQQVKNNESFDFTYHTQKGPSSGEWTSVGFVEKIYESADCSTLTYDIRPSSTYDTCWYSIDITPDGYDTESVVNDYGDVFSKTKEFSKIHKFGQKDFWEKFAKDEAQSFISTLGKAGEVAGLLLETNIFGKNRKDGNRYFFFPYTQFIQPTLKDVQVDIKVASYGKSLLPGSLTDAEIKKKAALAFMGRTVRETGPKVVKSIAIKWAENYFGLGPIVSIYKTITSGINKVENLAGIASGGKTDLDIEQSVKDVIAKNKKVAATISSLEKTKDLAEVRMKENKELGDRTFIFEKKQEQWQRDIELTMAQYGVEEFEMPIKKPDFEVEHFEEVKEITLESELEKLVEQIEKQQIKEQSSGQVQPDQAEPDQHLYLGAELPSKEIDKQVEPDIETQKQVEPDIEERDDKKDVIPQDSPVIPQEVRNDSEVVEVEEVISYKASDLVINEFLSNPSEGSKEWIEIFNNTDQSIYLDDWTIEDNTGKPRHLKDLVISPHSFTVLHQGQEFSFYLNNSSDHIVLKHKDTVIDEVSYGSFNDGNISDNASQPEKGQALARKINGKDTHNDAYDFAITTSFTPGLSNSIVFSLPSSGGSSSIDALVDDFLENTQTYTAYSLFDVVVSEVAWMGTQSSYNDEWLEIYNNSSMSVDLSGWHLKAVDGTPDIALGGTIPAHTYWALERTDNTTISSSEANLIYTGAFTNGGEYLQLIDGRGNVIDELNFSEGWPAGDNDTKASMERINFTALGSEISNWQTHSGQNLYAKDVDGNDILGTPGQASSEPVVEAQGQQEQQLSPDADGDGIVDEDDNCINTANANQLDFDNDGIGDACDDHIPPEITISSKPANPTNQTTASFEFSANEAVTFSCRLDSGTWDENCQSPIPIYTNLTEETHTFYLSAVDPTNNQSEATYSWTVEAAEPESEPEPQTDITPPVISSVQSSNITINSATISWSTDEASTSQIEYGLIAAFGGFTTLAADLVINHSQEISGLSPSTTYYFRAVSKDVIGNQEVSSNSTFTTLALPDVDGDGIADANDNCINTANANQLDFDNDGIGDACDDHIPPEITISSKPANPTNQTTASFEFSANEAVTFSCRLDSGTWDENCQSPIPIYTNLTEETHTFYLKAVDFSGNQSETTYSWTVDITSPISSISTDGGTFNVASWGEVKTIEGTADDDVEDVEVQVQKGLGSWYLSYKNGAFEWVENDNSQWVKAVLDKSNNTWHFDLPKELLSDENYFIRSRAIDPLGNRQNNASVIDFIFDNTPPGIAANTVLAEERSLLDLKFSWDDINDNLSGINHYEISWEDGSTTSTTSTLFRLKGKDRENYYFKVRAVDKAGNFGQWSAEILRSIKLPSVVISEVRIAGQTVDDEFIEIYNPTDKEIDLTDYQINKKNSQGNESTLVTKSRFKDQTIRSKSHVLLARQDQYQGGPEPDVFWPKSYSLTPANTIILYNPERKIIDKVGWGQAKDFETSSASEPQSSQSIVRYPGLPNGNNQDTDNNANDFFISENPNPTNSLGPWLNRWEKRQVLVIDNKENANSLTDYAIKIDVSYGSEMKTDFSDIRFASADGATLLSYYREEYIESQSAVFWVKVPSIPKYSEVIIYQYYGNDTAGYDGSGESVFVWFDDFDTNRADDYIRSATAWDHAESNGYIRMPCATCVSYITPKDLEVKNVYIKTKMMLTKKTGGMTRTARQGYINYRRTDDPGDGDTTNDNYWQLGKDSGHSWIFKPSGLHLDKVIDGNINRIAHAGEVAHNHNEWGIYEVWAYETNHKTHFKNTDFEKTWEITSHYLNHTGKVYLRADSIEVESEVRFDYLIIAKYTQPEPTVSIKTEEYIPIIQSRDIYTEFPGWGDRKTITITNTTNTTSTNPVIDYAIKVEFNHLQGMKPDFSDVRFTDSDKSTMLSYWNESYIENISAIFWVKAPSIPANGEKNIYFYYNNPSATYIGNGEDVFLWFDDFDTNKNYGSVNTVEGYAKLHENGYIGSGNLNIKDVYVKARMKMSANKPGATRIAKARQAFINYRRTDDPGDGDTTNNIYWQFGIDNGHNWTTKPNGLHFEKVINGIRVLPRFVEIRQFAYTYNYWDEYEVWAYDNTHKVRFVRQDKSYDNSWEAVDSDINENGRVYLTAGIQDAGFPVLVDYFIIGKYNSNITASINL